MVAIDIEYEKTDAAVRPVQIGTWNADIQVAR